MGRTETKLTDDEYAFAFKCLAAGPRGRALLWKRWQSRFGRDFGWPPELKEPIIIGAEPMTIGSDPGGPRRFSPSEVMRPVPKPPPPALKIVDEREPPFSWRELCQGLRSDPELPMGLGAVLAALAWWYWLARGGALIAIGMDKAGGTGTAALILAMPILLSLCAFAMLLRSIGPEVELLRL